MQTVAPAGSPRIQQVIDYKGGVLFVASNGIYTSKTPTQVFSGSDVKKILDRNPGITSVANYGGQDNIESYTVTVDKYKNEKFVSRETRVNNIKKEGTLGLLVALKNGYIYHSPDGNNLLGGGKTVIAATPINTDGMKNALATFMSSVKKKENWIYPKDVKVNVYLANQWDSVKLINADWNVGVGLKRQATAVAFDFAGNPATVDVYDKGWSGMEYKWRYKKTSTGIFSQSTKVNVLGDDGVLVRPSSGCAIIAAVTSTEIPDETFSPTSSISISISIDANNTGAWSFMLDGSAACKLVLSKAQEQLGKKVDSNKYVLNLYEYFAAMAMAHVSGDGYLTKYCTHTF